MALQRLVAFKCRLAVFYFLIPAECNWFPTYLCKCCLSSVHQKQMSSSNYIGDQTDFLGLTIIHAELSFKTMDLFNHWVVQNSRFIMEHVTQDFVPSACIMSLWSQRQNLLKGLAWKLRRSSKLCYKESWTSGTVLSIFQLPIRYDICAIYQSFCCIFCEFERR